MPKKVGANKNNSLINNSLVNNNKGNISANLNKVNTNFKF